jgi:hypothetical protein
MGLGAARVDLVRQVSGAAAGFPELGMQPLRFRAQPGSVPVGDGPRNRSKEDAPQQSFAVVALDRVAATLAGGPFVPALDRIAPPRHRTATEVASHEHMFA